MPLQIYLKGLTATRVTMSFKEVEAILNAPLPKSAYNYQAWWVNSEKAHSHASAWLEAGYEVRNVKFGQCVEFVKREGKGIIKHIEDTVNQQINSKELSYEEINYIEGLSNKMEKIRGFLSDNMVSDFSDKGVVEQYESLKGFRRIIGNIDNDLSFLGCLLIKEFLIQSHSFYELNMALKPQGSPGLDVDETTIDGKRVIGELKTTYPYQENDLGANQKSNFIKDFEKLQQNVADYKYFFVTELKTFDIVRSKYSKYLKGIHLVLLPQALSDSDFVIFY